MKKNLLCCALLAAAAISQSAAAQDFDDRWYISGGVGQNFQDSDRNTENAMYGTLGLGKFISPNWSIDAELNYQNPSFQDNGGNLLFSQYGISVDARYHFISEARNWAPYIAVGIGAQKVEEEYSTFPSPNSPGEREDTNLAGKIAVGLQANYERISVRGEVGTRLDFDDQSVVSPNSNSFGDLIAGITMLVKLGDLPTAVVPTPTAPAQQTCADLDDDGDGINNCDDKCPGSVAGQAIGPDGCVVALSIDLKGVNFDFDKDTLRPDAEAILAEAVQILQKYPQLKVEVAGHTDSVGTEQYNQGLSERRAATVYNYLTNNGVDASRLVGPNGFGESRPIDTNDTSEGRARNRRTELNVQN